MRSSNAEQAAVAVAADEAKKAVAAAKREAARERRRQQELSKDIWYQTTKVVVPAWFGNSDVDGGIKLGQTFTAAGLLALVAVGKAGRAKTELGSGSECEVGMQMKLRPSGFDRQEARDLAELGFNELRRHKLVRQVKKPTDSFPYSYYVLSAKGMRWYELIERSAGCAPSPDVE